MANINTEIETTRRKLARESSPLQEQIGAGQQSAAAATERRQKRLNDVADTHGAKNMRGPQGRTR